MSHAASSIVQTGSAISARNGSVSDDAHGCSTPKANGFGADEGGYEANGTAPITAFTSTKSERVARIASGSRRNEELDQNVAHLDKDLCRSVGPAIPATDDGTRNSFPQSIAYTVERHDRVGSSERRLAVELQGIPYGSEETRHWNVVRKWSFATDSKIDVAPSTQHVASRTLKINPGVASTPGWRDSPSVVQRVQQCELGRVCSDCRIALEVTTKTRDEIEVMKLIHGRSFPDEYGGGGLDGANIRSAAPFATGRAPPLRPMLRTSAPQRRQAPDAAGFPEGEY